MVRVPDGPKAGCRLLAVMLFVLALCGAAPVSWRGAAAQVATPTAFQGNPCLDGSAQATTQAADSPIFDYVILLDVSGSMEGIQNDGSIDPTKIIMPAVKESLKQYLSELQPGSQVTIIPFTGQINADNVLKISIEDTPDPDNALAEADAYIDGVVAGQTGGTFITAAISYGLDELAQSRDDDRQHIQTMLLFTDGEGNGPTDLDENNDFIVDNLLDAIDEYKREQPYLFVKYVSLGVPVPDAAEMEQRGVDVVETVDGVPPVREVRVAIVPDQLDGLGPGVAAANLLCATSGEVGDGIQVAVNDDPSELPADVQIAFRSEGSILTAQGLPLTYTLASTPTSGLGPFTTYVEVKSADPEVLVNPSRLPVTVTLADPTPAVTLDVGEFPAATRTRGVDTGDVTSTLPLHLTAPDGGAVALSLDTDELAGMAPGATTAFVAGDDELGATATLSVEQPALDLRLTIPAADIDALEDGSHTLPVGIIITPQGAEVTITGADATPQLGGAQRVTPGAGLTLNPQPVCGIEVAPVPGQVLLEGDQSPEEVRWETTVTLTGHDGCAGTLTFDDSALQQAIPGARAAFDVNGDAPLQLDLRDTPARVVLVVTAPRASLLALGEGDHPQTVDLVASTPAQLLPPEGLTPDEAGAYAIPITLPLAIGDRPGVACQLPVFADEEIVADGAQEPAITRSGEVTCTFAGDVSATLRVGATEDGVTATLTMPGGTPGRAVTLDKDHPSATLNLEVARSVPQDAGEGAHTYTAPVTAQASTNDATLELDGQAPDTTGRASSEASLVVRVAGEQAITIAPFALTPDPVKISTFDTEPDPLEWRGEITFELDNGADGTLQIDLPADSPVSAFFQVGDTTLPDPVQLAGQSSPLVLVVQLPLATAQAVPPGSQPFVIPLTLDPQGARVAAPDFARDGEQYRDTETASLHVTAPPIAEVGGITLPPGSVSTSDDASDPVRLQSDPIPYELKDGANARLEVDDAALQGAYPGASAGFVDGTGEPVDALALTQNGRPVSLVIQIPLDSLTVEGPQSVPPVSVSVTGLGEGTILTRNGVPVTKGEVEPDLMTPVLDVTVPNVTLDPGAWQPDVLGVPINGSGTGNARWERTLTLSNREEGANPAVSLSVDNPALTTSLYDGEIADDRLLAEGTADQPATATFAPGHDQIVAVVSAPESDLRALGLGDRHPLASTLTIDPRGSEMNISGGQSSVRQKLALEAPVTARVFQPFDLQGWVLKGLLALLALLALVVLWIMRPGLPGDAAVDVDGANNPTNIMPGTLIGPGCQIDVPTNGMFGEIKGTWGGRRSGVAKFVAGDMPIDYLGDTIQPGASRRISPFDTLIEPQSSTTIAYLQHPSP